MSCSLNFCFMKYVYKNDTFLGEICLAEGWMMKMYLSTAIRRMENEEKKTQVDWTLPTSLQIISWVKEKQ